MAARYKGRNLRSYARSRARRYGLDPDVFEAQIQQESGFVLGRSSPAGAQGIAQIMPGTAKAWGVDPNDPLAALDAAAKNMAKYVRDYKGDYRKALAAYNAGPGAVQKYGGVPPFKETQHYVSTILKAAKHSGSERGGSSSRGAEPPTISTPEGEQPVTAWPTISLPQLDPLIDPRARQMSAEEVMRSQAGVEQALAAVTGNPAALSVPVAPRTESAPTETPEIPEMGSLKSRVARREGTNPWKVFEEEGLTITSRKRPGAITSSGNVSDHSESEPLQMARDGAGTPAQMERAARRIAKRLKIKNYKPGQTYNVNRRGFRYQLIYGTDDHLDHVHLGRRRIR